MIYMLKWLFESKEERAERKAREREELFRRVREQERLEEQRTEFANKLVKYNVEQSLGFNCWRTTKSARGWIDCQSYFTKPMLKIYTENQEFLEKNSDTFSEIALIDNMVLNKYKKSRLFTLARTTVEELEEDTKLIDTVRELYNGFNEEDKKRIAEIEISVLNLIIDTVDEQAKKIAIDYNNTALSEDLQRSIFKVQVMSNMLESDSDVYGQALRCFNLRQCKLSGTELEQVENKIDFIKNNKEQLQEIVNKMAEVEELTNNTNLKATVRTPFGQIPQAYVDFQRKLVELKFEELVKEYGDIIKNEEYSQEWLNKLETVQSQLYNVLQTIKIEMTVLRNSGIIF